MGLSEDFPTNVRFFNRAWESSSVHRLVRFIAAWVTLLSVDSDKVREELLKLKTKTVFGDFAVDERGFQIGQRAVTIQWQDGEQVVVWPDDVAGGKPRFPTPPWSQR